MVGTTHREVFRSHSTQVSCDVLSYGLRQTFILLLLFTCRCKFCWYTYRESFQWVGASAYDMIRYPCVSG